MINNDLLKIFKDKYSHFGMNLTCIINKVTSFNFDANNLLKRPYHEWESLKLKKQTLIEQNLLDWNNAVGIGTVAGWKTDNKVKIIDVKTVVFIDIIDTIAPNSIKK